MKRRPQIVSKDIVMRNHNDKRRSEPDQWAATLANVSSSQSTKQAFDRQVFEAENFLQASGDQKEKDLSLYYPSERSQKLAISKKTDIQPKSIFGTDSLDSANQHSICPLTNR